MSRRTASFRVLHVLVPAALLALSACKSEPSKSSAPPASPGKPAEISNEFSATAHVVAIAPAERRVTLRRDDGTLFDVHAGEGVRNFDRIVVGDVLHVRYQETLTATRLPPGASGEPSDAAFAAGRAPVGAKPAAGAGWAFRVRARIESIDLEKDLVVYSLASGELNARKVETPEGRQFIKSLQVGDLVDLVYTEAVAVAIDTP